MAGSREPSSQPVNTEFFDGQRLLLCDLLDVSGRPAGYTIAVDVVDAGVGDTVLILDEGSSARQIFDLGEGEIRTVVVGIVDQMFLDDHEWDVT